MSLINSNSVVELKRSRSLSNSFSLLIPLICFCCLSPHQASAASSWHLDTGGSFKSIFGLQYLRQQGIFQHDRIPFNEERLRLQGSLSNRSWRFEFANETSFLYQRANASVLPIPDFNPTSAWNAKWNLLNRREVSISDRIDRAFVQYTNNDIQLIAGKQVIATGVGQIFGAVSQVQRYPFIVIDSEYQKTEDAVTFIWSGPLQLEARFLPKAKEQKEQNFHLRAKGSKGGYDVAMTAGRSDDKTYIGLESAGNLGDALLRGELVGYDKRGVHFVQALTGLDYVFSPTISSKWEFFYNGFGKAYTNEYRVENFPHRSAPYRGRWYGAFLFTWEMHPLLKTNLLSVVNIQDPGALFHLYLNYSLSNSLDLLVGQFLSFGKKNSEFGGRIIVAPPNLELGQPDISYAALRWYF